MRKTKNVRKRFYYGGGKREEVESHINFKPGLLTLMPVKKGDSKQKFYEVKQKFANLSRNNTTSFFWNSFGDLLPLFSWY